MPPLGRLDDLPRVRLGHAPTALEAMPNLGAAVGAAHAWVKRDDCTGLAFGGNKVRQLEFYFGEALEQNATVVLITGAIQSNFVRLTAAAAAKLGMACHVQLEHRTPRDDAAYRTSGNVLLDRMLGAAVHYYPHGEDEAGADRALEGIAAKLRDDGHSPYIIHLAPGHPPLGALGYVVCARELLAQASDADLDVDEFVLPSGSGATHAGFLFGLRALGAKARVTGACVRRDAEAQRPRLIRRCQEIADLLGVDNPVAPEDIVLDEAYLKPGYGQLNTATREAIALTARTEGLLLDPVYTGKCAAAYIAAIKAEPDRTKCLLHTGGTPAIFAYADDLADI